MQKIIELKNVTAYRGDTRVFDNLSLELIQGRNTVILGPNGAGKTTLLKLLCRDIYPLHRDDSVLRIFGQEHWNVWELRAHLGIVSHDLQRDYVGYARGVDVILSGYYASVGTWAHQQFSADDTARAERVMNDLGIAHLHDKLYAQMSTGEQRRFLLGRALVNDPDTLILDEPTSGLDLHACFHYIDVIRGLMRAGKTVILVTHQDTRSLAFARRDDRDVLSQQGPATPDHVIRTKRVPLLGRDVSAYAADYANYFAAHAACAREPKTMLDPAPRVVLDAEFGVCTVGRSAREAAIVADIYQHSIDIMQRAAALGGYQALPPGDIFDVEYCDLEQAKLRAAGKPPLFGGEIALVTGAASGIGRACVEALLARGAAVIGLDINAAVTTVTQSRAYLGQVCDITAAQQLNDALETGVRRFGGLDMLILNAGVFPAGCRIESLEENEWRRVMAVNLDANLTLLRVAHPLLVQSPKGARVVVIGSKNVPAPGIGAAAYSASKAALTQLARIAALEWGGDGIRVNTLHPDAVFDTGVWTEEVLAARAHHYGLTIAQYKTRNVLKTEVTSRDVAELAAELCGPLFAKVTGAQLPIDGGNERVI